MMPLHAAQDQVIKLKENMTPYDCVGILSVSDLTSWCYASPAVTCQYLVIMFGSLTYSVVCPASTPFPVIPVGYDWLMG